MSLRKEYEETVNNFLESVDIFKKRLRGHLMEKDKEGRKEILREMDDDVLLMICNIHDPEHDDYEVCQSVKDVLDERKANQEGNNQ
jgi:hypothetical protein